VDRILQRDVVHIPDAAKRPENADSGGAYLMNEPCRSLLSIPVVNGSSVLGFLSLVNLKAAREWHSEHIGPLKVLANTLTDALTKVEAEKEINYMAYYDHLTALPNRLLFKDRLTQALLQAGRTGRRLGVVFLDLDSFKSVNDTLGHERGDELLRIIAERLKNCVRRSDTVSRFGGDEFLLLINNLVSEGDIAKVADNIMAQFSRPFELKGQEFYITASAGIAMYPVDGADADKLIKNADIAMYSAKEMGKSQYAMCSCEMKETVSSNVALTTSLYRALGRGEFIIYYQPQVCLQTKKITGLEALLRWRSPEHGMINPGRFIPLAEQTGLINPIGEWALRQACEQNMRWQRTGLPPVRMAVNLSIIQLRNPKLQDIIRNVLEETGLDPAYLELEITESVATRESDYIIDLLGRLKSLGVTLSIDDFGTEYSSLSRLKTLPVDRIKMDIQFVQGIDGSMKDKAITKVIINLAKNLGLKVIAEGVETESQLNFLYQKMCDEVQGFYYFRPMPADQVEFALKNNLLRKAGDPENCEG
jgi:diguanylate cyclase (GGDEF) domain